jgi:hypothetical protein
MIFLNNNSLPWSIQRKIIDFRPWYSLHEELLEFFEFQLFQIPKGYYRRFYLFCRRNKPYLLQSERYSDLEWTKWVFGKIFNGESPWNFVWFHDGNGNFQECETLIYWLRMCGQERKKLNVYGWTFQYILTKLLHF